MDDPQKVVSAPRFVIDASSVPGVNAKMGFSELTGITSKVSATEYAYCDEKGMTHYSKQFGKTEAATVKLKRGFDSLGMMELLKWHGLARNGIQDSRVDVVLEVYNKGKSDEQVAVYRLAEAWLSDINVSGMKAGDSGVATIEVTITCANIDVTEAGLIGDA